MTRFVRMAIAVWIVVSFIATPHLRAASIPDETINRAIERGVTALRKLQGADGSYSGLGYGSGPTSLAALAMLECGVNANDEQLRKAVDYVRADCPTMNRVYNLALAIMLLDRLDDPLDVPVIHILAVRLLEGQRPEGGWHYLTPDVSTAEADRVRSLLKRRTKLKTVPEKSSSPADQTLDPDLIERLKRLERREPGSSGWDIDNSNTQFAVLGAWVARRKGVPVDFALRRAEAYFRATNDSGAWPYVPKTQLDGRPANTCAGLLGLAVGTGVFRDAQLRTQPERRDGKPPLLRDPLKDPMVQVALNLTGRQVAELAATGLYADVNVNRNLYFLWSVERVGMVYSVQQMGGIDWYQLGAATIIRAQLQDGTWSPRTMGNVTMTSDINICFALLFLRKSNFAHDLTAKLRNKLQQTTIRSGGDHGEPVPDPATISESERLVRELPTAARDRQDAILAQLRDGKGTEFTDALASAIPKLTGDLQKKARDALAERIARMNAATVRSKLKDGDAEIRRASALACAMKDDKGFIPDLIAELDDKDAWVIRAAAVALRTLTGQDFGPSATASADERAKAIAAWKAWWKRQNSR